MPGAQGSGAAWTGPERRRTPDRRGPGSVGGRRSSDHDAAHPGQVSAAGWRQVLRRAGGRVLVDRLPVVSAGVAFFAVLSVAPVLVTALSVYGAVNTPAQAQAQLSAVAGMLPPALERVVADQLTSITAASTQVLTRRGLTGLLVALWTATTAATCLVDAITVAYCEVETRPLRRRVGLALGLVLCGALLTGAVIAMISVGARALSDAPAGMAIAGRVLVWPLLAVLMTVVLAVLYRIAPDRRRARWHWTSWGAAGATVLWLAASLLLFAWVQQLGTYESTYGSLAGVAISMFWLFITVFLVLVGATVNAEVERQTGRDSTVGPDRPPGQRGAVVADSTPPHPAGR